MNVRFVLAELRRRRGRFLASVLAVAVGVSLFIGLQAYSEAYRAAARAPLSTIGTDVIAQKQGERPLAFEGVVFPHSTAPIHQDQIAAIRSMPGVIAVGQTLFLWSFESGQVTVGLGLDPSESVGPGRLATAVRDGRFLNPGERSVAVADANFAAEKQLTVGSTVAMGTRTFAIVGLVDTTRAGQVATANLYIPLADAQEMASTSANVLNVHDMRPTDANILFIKADPSAAPAIADKITTLFGSDAIVTTPRSFDGVLGQTYALIDRFGLLVGLAALLVAAAGLLRTTASSLWERRRDIGIMRAVGWRRRNIVAQLSAETLTTIGAGWIAGLAVAAVVTWTFAFTSVSVPVPWELSPTPMSMPGGPLKRGLTIPLSAGIDPQIALFALTVAIACGGLVGLLLAGRASNLKPAEVLRSE